MPPKDHAKLGLLYAIAAYGLWGIFPLYFKAVSNVAPVELLSHRALWSFVILAIIVALYGQWGQLLVRLRDHRLLAMLVVSSLLIGANWLLFLWSVIHAYVLQASLGYFINPLVSVLLGVVFFHERLRRNQFLAILLAACGVLAYTIYVGEFPWIAIVLALTFGLYGMLRKLAPVDGLLALTVETAVMAPFAAFWLGWLAWHGTLTGSGGWQLSLLLLAGPVTTIPLLFFGAAARRLPLSTMGVLQYLSPTLQFSVAVLVFHEKFESVQLACFGLIWTAIAIYTWDSFRAHRVETELPL